MARIFRRAGIAVFVLGAVITAISFIFTRELVELALGRALNKDVQIAGQASVDYGNPLSVHATQVSIKNAEWSARREMLTTKALTFSIDLPSLINGNFVFPFLSLTGPDLILERSVSGENNWSFLSASKQSETAKQSGQTPPVIRKLLIKNGRITYQDHQTGDKRVSRVSHFFAHEAANRSMHVKAMGDIAGRSFRIEGSVGCSNIYILTLFPTQ